MRGFETCRTRSSRVPDCAVRAVDIPVWGTDELYAPNAMGIAYQANGEIRLVVAVIDGNVDADEFREVARQQANDPAFRACNRTLTDATTATISPPPSAEEIAAFAADYTELRAKGPPGRSAIVAGDDRTLAGRYSDRRSDAATRVMPFRDLEPACMWLGVSLDDARSMIDELREGLRATRDTASA